MAPLTRRRNILACLLIGTLTLIGGPSTRATAQEAGEAPAVTATPSTMDVLLKIYAKGNGRPVARAEVKLGDTKLFADKNGEIALPIPANGDGIVEIYRHSFEMLQIDFPTLRSKPIHSLYLSPAAPADNEVVIRGAKRPETSRKTISIQEAAKVAPGGDPAQVPKLLPGVQSSSFSPQIIVRGSGPDDSRYYIDEWTVPFIFHRIGNISIIPDQLLDDVEFSSGGFGAQYGGATGGVVALRTKSTVPDDPKTEFRLNIPVLSSIYHERPIDEGRAMVAISARRSYLEAVLPLVLPKDQGLTVVPYFGDTHFYYLEPRDDGHVKVLGLYAYDGLKLLFPSDVASDEDGRGRFNLKDRVCLLGAEWKGSLGSNWSLTVAPRVTDAASHFDILGNRIHIDVRVGAVHAEATKRFDGKNRLYIGTVASYIAGRADVLAPKVDFSDPFFDFEEAPKIESKVAENFVETAAWVAMDRDLGPWLVTPGARVFHATQIRKAGIDPRLNARYQFDEANAMKVAVGKYSQTPEFRDTSKSFGNPDLQFIKSYHYVLGLETNWDDRWTTDFQTFYKETQGLVRSDAATNTNNDGSLISAGFEAFIRRNLTQRLFGWLAYTYSKTRERDSDQETYRNSANDQTHIVNLAGNYKITAIWDLGGRFIYHTGDTYTPVDDAVYNTNLDKYQPRTDTGTRLYSARQPNYHELDIYANKDILFDTWKMALRFGIEFLALKRQVQSVQYNYDYSKEEYFTGVPPIPYIELRGVL